MNLKEVYLRNETYANEHRTPLIPKDVRALVTSGFTVIVESSKTRIYNDKDYEEAGAIIAKDPWYSPQFQESLILGIKELNSVEYLKGHSHAYFSHSFKRQKNAAKILATFQRTSSKLYDFEYFLDPAKKRILAFGFHAGQVGAILGLLNYINKLPFTLSPWDSFEDMINTVQPLLHTVEVPKIGIIGAKGRCGQGVKSILNLLQIPFTELVHVSESTNFEAFKEFDIFYNCILLDEFYTGVWFNSQTVFKKRIVIVDISCDVTKPNQPIQLYEKSTSWESPVYKYNDLVDILAIDNLPSLLPKESSDHFSKTLTRLLVEKHESIWSQALQIFEERSMSLPSSSSESPKSPLQDGHHQ